MNDAERGSNMPGTPNPPGEVPCPCESFVSLEARRVHHSGRQLADWDMEECGVG